MKIVRSENISYFKHQSQQFLQTMLSPLCGITQEIGHVARTHSDIKMIVGSGGLTGMHVLLDQPHPGRGAYHIGGSGFLPQDAMIRILGETIERYAQLMSNFSHSSLFKWATHDEMSQEDDFVLPFELLCYYSNKQLSRMDFPFVQITRDQPITWIKMFSCYDHSYLWVPAQLILVGYKIRVEQREPWISSAVTTGTAAHTLPPLAFYGALLELIQLDSVIGHWYSAHPAYQIEIDHSLPTLIRLLKKYSAIGSHRYYFYYLPNPDLAGVSIACVYLQNKGLPKVVMGLGSGLSLEKAMYKAFLEMVASLGLARMVLFKQKYCIDRYNNDSDHLNLYDLDRNVEFYAAGNNFKRIEKRFLNMPKIKALNLSQEMLNKNSNRIEQVILSFKNTNKQLYYLDLTNVEAKSLGFKVVKVWSPQTLGLCLPSAPQVLHPRFNNYGGIDHEDPHPYP